jgi:NADPH:quinone reductase-like Zn-dependent oxidoreductase
MKAIILPDYNANIIRAMKSLAVGEVPVPEPKDSQVLIRVMAAPCNPSDIAFMRGGYGIRKQVPAVMGFECTGQVVEAGTDPGAKALLGKSVSCFSQGDESGTWAEYFMADSRDCIVLKDEVPVEQAAALCVNPFTAYALVKRAKERQAHAIIQNSASGQVGIFIRRLAAREGIKVINLVRKEEHIEALRKEGESHVLSINDPEFSAKLHHVAKEVNATVAFDAVGGDTSGLILNAMPPGSGLIIYGGLSGKPAGMFDALEIIFQGKTIEGFNLGDWKKLQGENIFIQVSHELQDLIISGVIHTSIQAEFPLEDVQQALEQYIRNMSSGKILFRP